ncbi:hypothetical protein ABLN87_18610, partial [Ruegeria sp. SCPT10]|uniref:CdiA C-terminal domain-containing protein n=1 Tax=Ruegeria sp. SCP10 TaxID=3141377 RepID=UPI0033375884
QPAVTSRQSLRASVACLPFVVLRFLNIAVEQLSWGGSVAAIAGVLASGGEADNVYATASAALLDYDNNCGPCVFIIPALVGGLTATDYYLTGKDAYDLAQTGLACDAGSQAACDRVAEMAQTYAVETGISMTAGQIIPGDKIGMRLIRWMRRNGDTDVADAAYKALDDSVGAARPDLPDGHQWVKGPDGETGIMRPDGTVANDAGDVENIVLGGKNRGNLDITAANPSASERAAAEHMASLGRNVELRDPVGTRAGGGTSDLLVDGVPYDVYTPTSANPNRIISAIAKKNDQATGIVVDLSNSTVTADQLGNVLGRVNGAGATNITDIVIIGN